jgi:hypothetical protein
MAECDDQEDHADDQGKCLVRHGASLLCRIYGWTSAVPTKGTNYGNFGVCQLAENNLPVAGRFVRNFVTKVGTALAGLYSWGGRGVKKILGSDGNDLQFEWSYRVKAAPLAKDSQAGHDGDRMPQT